MKLKENIIQILFRLFPKKILKLLVLNYIEKKPVDSYKFKISFSQKGEDIMLQSIFDKKTGFYIDIGAFHPTIYSNTNVFYLKGWRGINIEPNPDNLKLFNQERCRDINLNMAVAEKECNMTYYKFNYPAVNSLSKEHAQHWAKQPGHIIEEEILVVTKPIEKILDQYLPANTEIDFMSVDCEGLDLIVLKSNNWLKYRPKVILVEFLYYDFENFRTADIYQFIISKGYAFYGIMGISVFFMEEKYKGTNENTI